MRRARWSLRGFSPNWRFTFVSVSLLLTMVVTAIAAYQLHASLRAHDEAVERMLSEYARYASRTFGEALLRHGLGTAMEVMAAPTLIPAEGPGRGMSLAEFAAHADRAFRIHEVEPDGGVGYFRLDLGAGSFEETSSALPPQVAAVVDSVVRDQVARGGTPESGPAARFDIAGEPFSMTFALQRTRTGEPVAALGFVISRRHVTGEQARWVMGRIPLLPYSDQVEHLLQLPAPPPGVQAPARPAMAPPARLYGDPVANDSLLAVEILDERGRTLFRSPQRFESSVQGEFTFRTGPGGFTIRSTLSPRVIAEVRALHRPDRSRHYALLLPLLSLVLGASALVHLLRERELVLARRQFVASVSHELRTPLAQIQIMAETLLRGRERSDAERRRWLAVIRREAYRMGGLVENILMFSHLERDDVRLAREPTDLAELVGDVVDTFGPVAEARHTTLAVEVPDDIVADIDPRAVRQVLGNLLDNALKYGPEGQTVRVAAVPTGEGWVMVSVADEGPGVPPDRRAAVWMPFQRLDHRDGSAGGSGLGLAVVDTLIAHHGGTTSVTDAPGGGARFAVTLPLAPRPALPPPATLALPTLTEHP